MKTIKARSERTRYKQGQRVRILNDYAYTTKPFGTIINLQIRRGVPRIIVERDTIYPAFPRIKPVVVLTSDKLSPMWMRVEALDVLKGPRQYKVTKTGVKRPRVDTRIETPEMYKVV